MDPTLPPASPHGFKVGDVAPNLVAYDQDDHAAPLYRFAQQALLLDFCAWWCLPCQRMAFSVTLITETLRNAGIAFTYLTVLLQDGGGRPATVNVARAWARRFGITTPVLHPRGEADSQAWQQFLDYTASNDLPGGGAFPTLVFLDPDRRIRNVVAGFMSADDIQHQFDLNLPFLADAAAPQQFAYQGASGRLPVEPWNVTGPEVEVAMRLGGSVSAGAEVQVRPAALPLGIRAYQAGHRVLFATAAGWVARLADAHAAGRRQAELIRLGRCT